jgi:hypothetical protein
MVQRHVQQHPHAAEVGGGEQLAEVLLGAVLRGDLVEAGDVVAGRAEGGEDWHEPEGADAELVEVGEAGAQAVEVADAVAVAVLKGADVDLVGEAGFAGANSRLGDVLGRVGRGRAEEGHFGGGDVDDGDFFGFGAGEKEGSEHSGLGGPGASSSCVPVKRHAISKVERMLPEMAVDRMPSDGRRRRRSSVMPGRCRRATPGRRSTIHRVRSRPVDVAAVGAPRSKPRMEDTRRTSSVARGLLYSLSHPR